MNIPWDIREEAELWARERGRHATVSWSRPMNCLVVSLDLKPGDPRLEGWISGRLKVEPREDIFFQRRKGVHLVGIPMGELSASFVRNYLQEGDLWSGRGRYNGLDAACKAAADHNERLSQKMKEAAVEDARQNARDHRRQVFDLPLVSVATDLE